jgi:hypothetical protein
MSKRIFVVSSKLIEAEMLRKSDGKTEVVTLEVLLGHTKR